VFGFGFCLLKGGIMIKVAINGSEKQVSGTVMNIVVLRCKND